MNSRLLDKLVCPKTSKNVLKYHVIDQKEETIINAIIWNEETKDWYFVEDKLLDMLTDEFHYKEDRRNFYTRFEKYFKEHDLLNEDTDLQNEKSRTTEEILKQQKHFDWYASNSEQTYTDYQEMPFWKAADEITYSKWLPLANKNKWLLDVGCAEGRSVKSFFDSDVNIVGIDISKKLIREAINRYEKQPHQSTASFIAATGTSLPFKNESFDIVTIYGVLHHLPNPQNTCKEVARVLKSGGHYLGSENNKTIFRGIFDWLMRRNPIWHEEAGEQPLISKQDFQNWFEGTGMDLSMKCSVYLPPHFVNLFGYKNALRILKLTDTLFTKIPVLTNNGGLVIVNAKKK